jgi:hypothetical protein
MIAVSPVIVSPAKYPQKFITHAMERDQCPRSRDHGILADRHFHRWAGHTYFGRVIFPVIPNSILVFPTGSCTNEHPPVFLGTNSIR